MLSNASIIDISEDFIGHLTPQYREKLCGHFWGYNSYLKDFLK